MNVYLFKAAKMNQRDSTLSMDLRKGGFEHLGALSEGDWSTRFPMDSFITCNISDLIGYSDDRKISLKGTVLRRYPDKLVMSNEKVISSIEMGDQALNRINVEAWHDALNGSSPFDSVSEGDRILVGDARCKDNRITVGFVVRLGTDEGHDPSRYTGDNISNPKVLKMADGSEVSVDRVRTIHNMVRIADILSHDAAYFDLDGVQIDGVTRPYFSYCAHCKETLQRDQIDAHADHPDVNEIGKPYFNIRIADHSDPQYNWANNIKANESIAQALGYKDMQDMDDAISGGREIKDKYGSPMTIRMQASKGENSSFITWRVMGIGK
jgi:hypothetical protein